MLNFVNTYLGPLDKNSCLYFFFLTIFFLIMFVITIITELIFIVKRYKQLDSKVFVSGLLVLFNSFIAYFVNRLLYTMCTKSLI